MVPYIPPELSDRIIDYLYGDFASLASCALTCRLWLPAARYHRFRYVPLPWVKLASFRELVDTSPELALFVESLKIIGTHPGSNVWSDEDLLFFSALSAVSELEVSMLTLDGNLQTSLVSQFPFVKRLAIDHRYLLSLSNLTAIPASFPLLDSLSIAYIGFALDLNSPPQLPRPPPNLKALEVTYFSQIGPVLRWLRGDAEQSSIESLLFRVDSDWDALALATLLSMFGAGLRRLHLHVQSHHITEHFLNASDAPFSLAHCTALRACVVHYELAELCVPESQGLRMTSALLARLASPFLEELVLALRVDEIDVLDLCGLDSECGVRSLTPPRFEDIRALDWTGLEETVAHGRFPNLRRLALEGKGDCAVLVESLRIQCPELIARNLVSFVSVNDCQT